MSERIAGSGFFLHLFSAIIPILSWIIITLPLWLSPFHPAVAAYFIITYNLYFFYKAIKTVYYSAFAYQLIREAGNIKFSQKLRKQELSANIKHFVIIPNYKEPLGKIEATIESLANTDYPYKTIYLVLAFEEREAEATKKATKLIKRFRKSFRDILVTHHVLTEGEVVGKASNQTYAAKIASNYAKEHGFNDEETLITICDADSIMPKNYFSYLTNKFLQDSERNYHFYWAPVLLYNNFWQIPFFVRMQATMSSIFRLSILPQKERLIQLSTYTTNLWLLKKIGFWDVDIIPEDWHVHLQAFFMFGQKVKTIPLYTIVSGDAVYSGTLFKTLKNRYEQERRWAWGVSDIGYALQQLFVINKVSWWVKLKKTLYLAENHLLWPTSFFILTLSGFVPGLINPPFKRSVLGFLLPRITSIILTLSSLTLLLYVYLDIKLRQRIKSHTSLKNLPFLFIQWYLLPIVSLVLSSLPALDAHTRMLFRKRLEYKVTEKV